MLRRNLLQFGFTATIAFLTAGSEALCADDAIAWGDSIDSLKIGLRLEATDGRSDLVVLVKNVGKAPRDLYLWDGYIPRIDFTARGTDGREYKLVNRLIYMPCAGLCNWLPIIKHVEADSTVKLTFALDMLLYVPIKGPYTTLTGLVQEGCSVRAAIGVTEKQVKNAKLSPELPWLGQATSGDVRKY